MTEIVYPYADNGPSGGAIELCGEAYFKDASFSHPFGVRHEQKLEVDNFKIYVLIDGDWENLTEYFKTTRPKMHEYYLNTFKDYCRTQDIYDGDDAA